MSDQTRERDLSRMSWPEVEARLSAGLRLAIIPVGSFEQHGPHLPLRTDYALAYGRAMRIAALTDAVVAPVVMAGLSAHHLDFPGTISLQPETLVAILRDTACSLARHGIDRIILLSGHGGNDVTIKYAAEIMEREAPVEVVALGVGEISAYFPPSSSLNLDIHAGLMETAAMLIYAPGEVRLERAERPTLRFAEPAMQEWLERRAEDAVGFKVLKSRLPSIRAFSDNGVVTLLDPAGAPASVAEREDVEERFAKDVAAFVGKWLEAQKETGHA
ncbi:MAG: creatininase family protein [Nitrososphaerales archaeon]